MTTPPTCIPFTGSTQCSEFSAFSFAVNQQFPTLAAIDSYVATTTGSNATFRTFFDSRYNCPNWDGTGLRYSRSFICGYIVQASTALGCNQGVTAPGLCKTTADAQIASYNTIFKNPAFCPTGGNASELAPYTQYDLDLQPNVPNCIVAVHSEINQCGFSTTAEAGTYCATTTGAADPCCPIFLNAASGANGSTSTTAAPEATGTVNPNANLADAGAAVQGQTCATIFGMPVCPVALGGIIAAFGVFVAIVVATILFVRKRNAQKGNSIGQSGKAFSAAANVSAGGAGSATIPVAETYEVVYDYVPNLFDEIELHVGDQIIVKVSFDDGWALGFNMVTKQEGSFPMACVVPVSESGRSDAGESARINQRASSLYNPSDVGLPR